MGHSQHVPSGVPASRAPRCRADPDLRPGLCRQACRPAGLLSAVLTWISGLACAIRRAGQRGSSLPC